MRSTSTACVLIEMFDMFAEIPKRKSAAKSVEIESAQVIAKSIAGYSTPAMRTIFALENFATSQPDNIITDICPSGIANSIEPNVASSRLSDDLKSGMRVAHAEKTKP